MQWKSLVVMSAITLSNTNDQSLWRNNKNSNSGQMILVYSDCLRKSKFISSVLSTH